MNAERVKKNEMLIGHMERLASIHQSLMTPQIGGDAPASFELGRVRDAISSLAAEIGVSPIEVPF